MSSTPPSSPHGATSMAPSCATDSLPNVLVWMDLEMTGLDPATRRDRRDRHARHRRRARDRGRGSRPGRPPAAEPPSPPWATSCATCTRAAGCCPPSRRRRSTSTRPARPRWRSSASTSPTARTVPLCGNSIGTDRRFLAAYLPDIENYLHYRSVDVSTIKELARRWAPERGRRRAAQGDLPPGARRHPRERDRAALVPRQPVQAEQRPRGRADFRLVAPITRRRPAHHFCRRTNESRHFRLIG